MRCRIVFFRNSFGVPVNTVPTETLPYKNKRVKAKRTNICVQILTVSCCMVFFFSFHFPCSHVWGHVFSIFLFRRLFGDAVSAFGLVSHVGSFWPTICTRIKDENPKLVLFCFNVSRLGLSHSSLFYEASREHKPQRAWCGSEREHSPVMKP